MKILKVISFVFLVLPLGLSAQTVSITSPNGGEDWALGTPRSITWTQSGLTGTARLLLLQGTTQVGVIDTNIQVTALQYSWQAGQLQVGTAVAGSNYRIQIRVDDPDHGMVMDKSNQGFTLSTSQGGASITVTSPKNGDNWSWNSTHAVTWTKSGAQAAQVKIQLFKGTVIYQDFVAATANDGSQDVTVMANLPDGSDYIVKVTTSDNLVSGSSQPFSISKFLIPADFGKVPLKKKTEFSLPPGIPLEAKMAVTVNLKPSVSNPWHRVHSYSTVLGCPLNSGGMAPAPDPSPLLRTGYRNYYDGGVCWEYLGFIYRGILKFDLSQIKGKVTEAKLDMGCTGTDSNDGTPFCDGSVFVLDGPGSGFNNPWHHLVDLPAQGGNVANDRIKVAGPNIVIVLTDVVSAWISGSQPNHGLIFLGNNETMDDESNDRCISHFQAGLSVTYLPD
jgi:hypothetical protein